MGSTTCHSMSPEGQTVLKVIWQKDKLPTSRLLPLAAGRVDEQCTSARGGRVQAVIRRYVAVGRHMSSLKTTTSSGGCDNGSLSQHTSLHAKLAHGRFSHFAAGPRVPNKQEHTYRASIRATSVANVRPRRRALTLWPGQKLIVVTMHVDAQEEKRHGKGGTERRRLQDAKGKCNNDIGIQS